MITRACADHATWRIDVFRRHGSTTMLVWPGTSPSRRQAGGAHSEPGLHDRGAAGALLALLRRAAPDPSHSRRRSTPARLRLPPAAAGWASAARACCAIGCRVRRISRRSGCMACCVPSGTCRSKGPMMPVTNPTACLLVIGNEVLSGRTQDANIRFLAIGSARSAFRCARCG